MFETRPGPSLPRWLRDAFPFRRRVARLGGHDIHFVDDGEGQPLLLMHGNPTWSFLWRKVIAGLPRGRYRVVAPDLFGFGFSSKPRSISAHTLEGHLDTVAELVRGLELEHMVVVGQDWGGPIAAGVAMREAKRVVGAVFANTAVIRPSRPIRSKPFHRFSQLPLVSDLVFRGMAFPIPVLPFVQGNRRSISPRAMAAYAYPLRRIRDRAGPLALARMVPNAEGHPSLAVLDEIGEWVESYQGPVALVWGKRDPILGRALARHRRALGQATVLETGAGHFLQEEVPEALVRGITSL